MWDATGLGELTTNTSKCFLKLLNKFLYKGGGGGGGCHFSSRKASKSAVSIAEALAPHFVQYFLGEQQ